MSISWSLLCPVAAARGLRFKCFSTALLALFLIYISSYCLRYSYWPKVHCMKGNIFSIPQRQPANPASFMAPFAAARSGSDCSYDRSACYRTVQLRSCMQLRRQPVTLPFPMGKTSVRTSRRPCLLSVLVLDMLPLRAAENGVDVLP